MRNLITLTGCCKNEYTHYYTNLFSFLTKIHCFTKSYYSMRKTVKFLQGLLVLFATVIALNAQAVEVTIGSGTNSSNYPFTTYWMDGRTQILLTAAELTAGGAAAGNINDIAFNVISNATQAMNGFNIGIQNTTLTTLSAFVTGGFTSVFSGTYTVPGTGWQTITFQNPYAWNGTSNILIEICYDNAAYSSYSPVYSTAAAGMTVGQYSDLSTASGCTGLTSGGVQANRPNVRMNIVSAGPSAPVTVTIGNGTLTTGWPYTTYWHDGRTQILVTKAEIEAAGGFAGMINHLDFNVQSVNTSYQAMNGFTVRCQNYPGTLSGFVGAGWTTVLTTTYTVNNTGWNTHTFTTPFIWNGVDNLLFEVCYDNAAYTSYSYVYATSVASGLCYYSYTDGAAGCSLTSATSTTSRPNVRFTLTPLLYTTLEGVVTNASTGAPINGAKVQAGDSVVFTKADGAYALTLMAGNINVTASKLGFDAQTVNLDISGNNMTQDFALLENTNPPSVVLATLNTAQTAVNVTWGLPQGPYEIIYDDGGYENLVTWAAEGNINALKFTPINSYPVQVTGGRVYIGDGSYPSGANLQPFQMAVYDDDGTLGFPGTELAVMDVNPTAYGWVTFTFPTPVTLTSGNFYLGMIQGGNHPNCVPIGVDETNPSMRSYSRFVTGNAPWVAAGYNDFMIRAIVTGAGGPLDLGKNTNEPGQYIEKRRENVGTHALKIPRLIGGQEGVATYAPVNTDNGDNTDVIVGYQVWRLKQGEENTPAAWLSIGTPTGTSIVDNSWPTLPCEAYLWAVKAKYTGDRWSDATFSNVLGKCWTANVTINVTMCSSSASPEGTMVKLTNTEFPDTVYFAMAPASGIVNFPTVWKGNYDIWVYKFSFTAWELNDDIFADKTYDVLLNELFNPPTNAFVEDRSLMASWNAPRMNLVIFEELWSSGSFATQGWTLSGTGNWGIATGFGMPAPSAQFNWSPSVTNYEQSLVSADISGIGSPGLNLKYDIYLSNFGTTTLEEMAVEIWDGAAWDRLGYYNNAAGDIPWTTETKNIDSYSFETFKIRFRAYGADSYNINNWNVDNIRVVGSAKGQAGKDLLGYNVYLDNIQIGFTTDTTYQIPHNLCTYGQVYEFCVDAAYECGTSDRDCYTFTAHYLPAPRNLEGVAVQDAAYLTWEHPVMGSKLSILSQEPRTYMPDPTAEYSPMVTNQQYSNPIEAIWDVMFTFNAAGASRPGVETDGTYIYTAQWNGGNFGKFQNSGGTWTLVNEFTVAGASNIRDLAYDGTYFYGGSASTTIYKMDFNTQTLVGTISTSGVNVRHIGFDPVNNGFWTGDWATMSLVSMTGATVQTANTGLSAQYGNAYDPQSSGGPFLWIYDQNGSGADLHQMAIATTTMTGVTKATTDLPGFLGGSIAGGLASDNGNLVAGKFILICNVQQDPNLVGAYEVAAGGGGGGAAPGALLGYNVYRNNSFIAYVEKPTTEYYDLYLNPGTFCYDVTAVYDISIYGFPAGTTAESLKEGQACVDINYGLTIPWMEDWNSAGFTYNTWSFAPDQGHWKISNMTGNAVPSAEFTWAPPTTDYSYAMITPALNASIFTCADIWLDFDLKLDDRNNTGAEKLKVDIYKNGNWTNVAEYTNTGSFNWNTKHIDISNVRGKAFKVRFVASGANTADILGWFVDNISVYPVVYPALNLTAQNNNQNFNVNLAWNSPACPAVGGGGVITQYILDDGTIENGWGINPGYSSWMGNEFPVTDQGVLQSFDVYFMANAAAGPYQLTIDVFDANKQLVGTSAPFLGQADSWITIPVNDIPFNQTFYAMLHWNMLAGSTHWFGSDENGPNAALNLEWYYDGTTWQKLTDFGYAPSVFALRATALVGGDKKVVTYGPATEYTAQPKDGPSSLMVGNVSADAGRHYGSRVLDIAGGKGVIGYNIYRNDELITPVPVTDTTYVDVVAENGPYCYKVTAIHEGFNAMTFESAPSNEACKTLSVGIGNPEAGSSLRVYPNPAKDFVNVEVTADIRTIEMVNYLGQSISTQSVDGKGVYRLNTANLESGVYFIRLTDSRGNISLERVTVTR